MVFDHLSHAGLHEDPETFNRATLDFLLRSRSRRDVGARAPMLPARLADRAPEQNSERKVPEATRTRSSAEAPAAMRPRAPGRSVAVVGVLGWA